METVEQPDGAFVVSHDRTRLARWLLGFGLVCALLFVYPAGRWSNEQKRGLLAGAGVCGLLGLVLWERIRFHFDPASRTIHWRRRWAWSLREGSLPFSGVQDVLVRSPIGDSGVPSRRLSLKLVNGDELPLSGGYLSDHGDRLLTLSGRLRQVLGLEREEKGVSRDVEALTMAGHPLDAVRLQRQTSDVSLERARREARRPGAVDRKDETGHAGRD